MGRVGSVGRSRGSRRFSKQVGGAGMRPALMCAGTMKAPAPPRGRRAPRGRPAPPAGAPAAPPWRQHPPTPPPAGTVQGRGAGGAGERAREGGLAWVRHAGTATPPPAVFAAGGAQRQRLASPMNLQAHLNLLVLPLAPQPRRRVARSLLLLLCYQRQCRLVFPRATLRQQRTAAGRAGAVLQSTCAGATQPRHRRAGRLELCGIDPHHLRRAALVRAAQWQHRGRQHSLSSSGSSHQTTRPARSARAAAAGGCQIPHTAAAVAPQPSKSLTGRRRRGHPAGPGARGRRAPQTPAAPRRP